MNPATPARTVLVTGAARRLGREIALGLATAGWQVAVHYRGSADDAARTVADCLALGLPGLHHDLFDADLDDEAAVRGLVPRVLERFGSLHGLVNNASVFEHDAIGTFGYASLASHMRVNAGAPVLLAQALHVHLLTRDGKGAVVNLLDQKLWNQNPDFVSYTLSKAALEAATTMLALGLAPRLRVVGVAPGLTITSHFLAPEKFAQLHRLSPLGCSSTPQDVVGAVTFALENQSITGTTLLVDGGQHLMKFERDFSLMP